VPALELDQISLRQHERAFVVGGSGCGKSTLSDALADDFLVHYRGSGARELLADSKPRYIPEDVIMGPRASRRYKQWDHGQRIPHSVLVETPEDLGLAWDMGYRRAIVQGTSSSDIPRMAAVMSAFLQSSRRGRPQLLRIDELLDFFFPNGSPRGGDDVILRANRAGRERGTSVINCSQRTKGIPTQVMEELRRLYAFRLDFVTDAKRFQEMGAPPFELPEEDYDFKYWWKGDRRRVWPSAEGSTGASTYRLALPAGRI
jgi:energy-coupling factor transporter ATP-binding protein EcfA2